MAAPPPIKLVRLSDDLLPNSLRKYDNEPHDSQLWPMYVYEDYDALKASLSELSSPGSYDHGVLMNDVELCDQRCPIRRAALPIHHDVCNTKCMGNCHCRHCSTEQKMTCAMSIGPRYYVHVKDAFSIQKKKKNMENIWRILMSKHKNAPPGSNGYDIINHAHQLLFAMDQCGAPMNIGSDTVDVNHTTTSPQKKRRRKKRDRDSSRKKPKKNENGNSNKAETAGGSVVDVSLFGDGPSTPPRPKPSGQSHHAMRRENKSHDEEGGSRLVLNKTRSSTSGPNSRTCLLDAVIALLPSNAVSEKISKSIIASMPPTGDTPVSVAAKALAGNCFTLETVTRIYDNKKGGIAYHLLQETKCKLILHLKLTNHRKQVSSHFVAWDGSVIHDCPYSSKVSNIKDRQSIYGCREVFSKLYRKFKHWEIHHVYRIREQTS